MEVTQNIAREIVRPRYWFEFWTRLIFVLVYV